MTFSAPLNGTQSKDLLRVAWVAVLVLSNIYQAFHTIVTNKTGILQGKSTVTSEAISCIIAALQ